MVRTLAHGSIWRRRSALNRSSVYRSDIRVGQQIAGGYSDTESGDQLPVNRYCHSRVVIGNQRTRQSRFPVYENHRDNVLGILHARDLLDVNLDDLKENREEFIKLLRKPYFVPESKPALELLDSFRESRRSFTLTVDEYGGVTGLVTMEDLLECIFGDIPSPSDQVDNFALETVGENQYLVDGGMPLDQFNEHIGFILSGEEIETIGGLVLHAFGELPQEGSLDNVA